MDGRVVFGVRPARILFAVTAAVLGASLVLCADWRLVPVQGDETGPHLAAGQILVARRSLEDPNFAETVIVLVQVDEDGILGLIINRQTKVPVSRLARDLRGAQGRSEPLYLGGPVATTGIMGLIRTGTKLEEAKHVFGDVYMISSKPAVEKAIASSSDSKTFRLYLGYAGWDSGQLEWEMGMDAWDVLPANAGTVFDPHPETLWTRLVGQEDLRMARLRNRARFLVVNLAAHAAD